MAEQEQTDYRCPMCGSETGTPNPDGSMKWYWRVLRAGRLGPFCSDACAARITLDDKPAFTLQQIQRLEFWRHRAQSEDRSWALVFRRRRVRAGPWTYREELELTPVSGGDAT